MAQALVQNSKIPFWTLNSTNVIGRQYRSRRSETWIQLLLQIFLFDMLGWSAQKMLETHLTNSCDQSFTLVFLQFQYQNYIGLAIVIFWGPFSTDIFESRMCVVINHDSVITQNNMLYVLRSISISTAALYAF